jgi:putative flippase GtrA
VQFIISNIKRFISKIAPQLAKFLIAGLPSFILAIPLNWFLVEKIILEKPIAYFITLLIQVSINFLLLRKFVFLKRKKESALKQFIKFLGGISFFRFLDWGLYTILVEYTVINYLYIQAGNVIVFALFKFLYSKHIMEKN